MKVNSCTKWLIFHQPIRLPKTPTMKEQTENNNSRLISFSGGHQLVTIGDVFDWWGMDKPKYQVISFNDGDINYSPSGLGGSIGVTVKDIRTGKTEEWCADSVANGIHTTNKKHSPLPKT